jgi:hypothetical protein
VRELQQFLYIQTGDPTTRPVDLEVDSEMFAVFGACRDWVHHEILAWMAHIFHHASSMRGSSRAFLGCQTLPTVNPGVLRKLYLSLALNDRWHPCQTLVCASLVRSIDLGFYCTIYYTVRTSWSKVTGVFTVRKRQQQTRSRSKVEYTIYI